MCQLYPRNFMSGIPAPTLWWCSLRSLRSSIFRMVCFLIPTCPKQLPWGHEAAIVNGDFMSCQVWRQGTSWVSMPMKWPRPWGIKTWETLDCSPSLHETRSTAFRRPWVFCDQRCIMDDSWCARANKILFDVIFKAVNPLFWCIFSKTCILPRRNYHFWGFWEVPN